MRPSEKAALSIWDCGLRIGKMFALRAHWGAGRSPDSRRIGGATLERYAFSAGEPPVLPVNGVAMLRPLCY